MATGDTFEQILFDKLGLTNEAAKYTSWLYPEADVRALEPDVIFCDDSIDPETVRTSYVYSVVAAAKNRKIMNIPIEIFERQTPRMFRALVDMAKFTCGIE